MTATARPQLLAEFIKRLERDGFAIKTSPADYEGDPYVEIGLDRDMYAVAGAAPGGGDGLTLVLYRTGEDPSVGAWFGVTADTAITILWGMKG